MAVLTEEPKQQFATQAAMHKIKELIFSGELVADSNHLESELATRLGLSRTPVREATLMLQAQGLLEVQPRKGIRIKSLSVQDVADFYEIVATLECLAAGKAAQAGLTSKDTKKLLQCMKEMDKATTNKDRTTWAIADEAYHCELVRLGGNRHIETIVRNGNDQLRRVRSMILNIGPIPLKSNKDHRKLYRAILAGDSALAVATHKQHLELARDKQIMLMENAGLKRV